MKLIPKKAVCGMLDISLRSLDRLIASQQIGVVKVGRLIRIKESEVNEFIRRNSHGGLTA